jgi:parvulin-like peptidyl-prolyl isomerase
MREARHELDRGEEFGVVVQIYSNASPSRSGGEQATFLTREMISQAEVADAAFSLPVGETSEMITSSDGYHIIKVEDRQTEDGTERVKIAEIFVPIQMSMESNLAIRDRAAEFADSARATGFAIAVEDAGLTMSTTGLCDPEAFIPGLGRVSAAKDFARTAEAGEVSRPIQTTDAWYVLHVAERQAAGPARLEEMRAQVRSAVLLEKRRETARQHAAAVLQRCAQGVSLEAAAQQETLAVFNQAENVTRLGFVRGLGSDPQLTGVAFASATGLIPRVVMGSQGAFVVETLERRVPADSLFVAAQPQVRQRLLQEKQNRLLREWMQELRDQAVIEDFRIAISSM